MSIAVRVWEDNFKIINKIRSKSERNALCFALIYYGFCGEVPQDLKLNENNLLLFEVLKNNFIAKNQGGAPVGNFNRCSTVEKNNSTDNQPLSENIKQKTEKENKTSEDVLQKKRTKKFIPPSFEEVKAYLAERGNLVDAQKFYDYFSAGNWHDSEGKPVKNWKQKAITWESKERTLNAAKGLIKNDNDFWRQLGC